MVGNLVCHNQRSAFAVSCWCVHRNLVNAGRVIVTSSTGSNLPCFAHYNGFIQIQHRYGRVKRSILKNLIETEWYSEIESKASNLFVALQSESKTDDAIAESEWDIANKSFSESISKYQEMYSRLGITSEGGTASTYSKGIAQASQDTVDELNGRMTVIQAHTGIISANTQSILQSNQAMLNELQLIQNNTAQLHQMRLDIAKLSDCVVNRTIKTTLN